MTSTEVRAHCRLEPGGEDVLRGAVERLALSARGTYKSLKVARTIADLAGTKGILTEHMAEAVQYRSFEALPGAPSRKL